MRNLCSFSSNNTGNQLCFRFFILFIFRYCLMFYRSWTDRSVPTSVSLLFQLMWKIVHFNIRYRWHGNGPGTGHQSCYCRFPRQPQRCSFSTPRILTVLWPRKIPKPCVSSSAVFAGLGGGVGVGGRGWEGGCVRVSVNVNERIPWSNMWWINLEATTVLYDTAMSLIVQQHLSHSFLGLWLSTKLYF